VVIRGAGFPLPDHHAVGIHQHGARFGAAAVNAEEIFHAHEFTLAARGFKDYNKL
jgi:hypothetical protein